MFPNAVSSNDGEDNDSAEIDAGEKDTVSHVELSLLEGVRSGDTDAFAKLVELHIDTLTQVAFYLSHSRDTADDIVQNIFIALWENRSRIDPDRSLKPYLLRSVRNRALDEHKSDQIRTRYRDIQIAEISSGVRSAQVPSPEGTVLDKATIQQALYHLPQRRRLALQLYLIDDLSESEIAEVLGASPQAADRLIRRALSDLRSLLKI